MKMKQEEEPVLIVEDDKDLSTILKHVLGKSHPVKCVHNLKDAEGFLQTHTASHLFLDNNLPDGLGIDFVPWARRNNPSAMIVLMTAHNFKNVKAKALENGADLFIQKPFSMSEIKGIMLQSNRK